MIIHKPTVGSCFSVSSRESCMRYKVMYSARYRRVLLCDATAVNSMNCVMLYPVSNLPL